MLVVDDDKKTFSFNTEKHIFPIDFLYALQPVKNKIKNGERGGKKVSVQWDGGVWLSVCAEGKKKIFVLCPIFNKKEHAVDGVNFPPLPPPLTLAEQHVKLGKTFHNAQYVNRLT